MITFTESYEKQKLTSGRDNSVIAGMRQFPVLLLWHYDKDGVSQEKKTLSHLPVILQSDFLRDL